MIKRCCRPAQYPTVREGDYLNIGAGTEVGIYMRPHCWDYDTNGLDHYFTDYRLSVPMTLSLYNYGGGIENIFHWYPQNDQWWITGFNPEHVGKVDVHKQVMVGSVDFSGFEELYENLIDTMNEESDYYNKNAMLYLIPDDNFHKVWICWYRG